MYALVEIKGKQYKAEKGAVIKVDKMTEEVGAKVEFDSVMLVSADGETKVGAPYVAGAKVSAVVKDASKDKKIVVLKFKRRKGYKRTQGHRQAYTYLRIEDVVS